MEASLKSAPWRYHSSMTLPCHLVLVAMKLVASKPFTGLPILRGLLCMLMAEKFAPEASAPRKTGRRSMKKLTAIQDELRRSISENSSTMAPPYCLLGFMSISSKRAPFNTHAPPSRSWKIGRSSPAQWHRRGCIPALGREEKCCLRVDRGTIARWNRGEHHRGPDKDEAEGTELGLKRHEPVDSLRRYEGFHWARHPSPSRRQTQFKRPLHFSRMLC